MSTKQKDGAMTRLFLELKNFFGDPIVPMLRNLDRNLRIRDQLLFIIDNFRK
jgi:hypothetical protein